MFGIILKMCDMLQQAKKPTPDRIQELAHELSWLNVVSALNYLPYRDVTEKADVMAAAADLAAFLVTMPGRMSVNS